MQPVGPGEPLEAFQLGWGVTASQGCIKMIPNKSAFGALEREGFSQAENLRVGKGSSRAESPGLRLTLLQVASEPSLRFHLSRSGVMGQRGLWLCPSSGELPRLRPPSSRVPWAGKADGKGHCNAGVDCVTAGRTRCARAETLLRPFWVELGFAPICPV